MDRRQPNRVLTVVVALVVLAILIAVLYSLGADELLPSHRSLARVLLSAGGMSPNQFMTWGLLTLALVGILRVLVAMTTSGLL
jgi:hypothetical protein